MAQNSAFPRIAIALGLPHCNALLECAGREAEAGESFFEFRLDYLPDPAADVGAIRCFRERHPDCMVLATCRRHQNHGRFNGSIEEQLQVLEAAVEAGAAAVDVEIESAEAAVEKLAALRSRARLVLSYHNFECTPRLEAVVRRMQRIPADGYKIVTTARKPSDNYRVLALPKQHPRMPLVVLAMGEMGFPTRVLSDAFGGLYTYAAPLSTEGTAAGQVCARQLRHVYRVDKFTKNARIYGVIASPVRHTISPAVHNRAFQATRRDAVYLPFQVNPQHLRDFFQFAEELPVAGFSVTIPHKQRVIRYLDAVDPLAKRIGAVNTVWRKLGKWRGTNTDVAGVVGPLARRLRLSRASILIAGNGGAARGAAFALAEAGASLAITGRNPDRVRAFAKICGAEPLTPEQAGQRGFDALVHATPLGMFPQVNECFFEGKIPAEVVFDMVYNPLETVLLARAREEGKEVIPGLEMFIEQAVRQFEIWTGEKAPRAAMQKAALEALEATR
ncbi:MAG: shikimate dehydrogenase [Bryobacterales bacterium]|nr:shikimate dehydrogenase [Bryobacterales bacterium]